MPEISQLAHCVYVNDSRLIGAYKNRCVRLATRVVAPCNTRVDDFVSPCHAWHRVACGWICNMCESSYGLTLLYANLYTQLVSHDAVVITHLKKLVISLPTYIF